MRRRHSVPPTGPSPRGARRPAGRAVAATLGLGVAAALVLAPATAVAHRGGDTPTNERAAQVAESGTGEAMDFVANLQYDESGEAQNGSDIEFARIAGRDYALAGTLRGGMQIVDVTDPEAPERVAVYDCAVTQGDIQVWKDGGRVLASYTADGTVGAAGAASRCGRELDLSADDAGTILVDITKPAQPTTVSFLTVPAGSHNMTIDPSGSYLYNSNSDLLTARTEPHITIYDVRDPRQPKKVQEFPIPYVPTSLGSEAHDITFDESGDRAYVAALSQTLVLDTTDLEQPEIIGQVVDPSLNVVHQADPVTLERADGTERDLLVVTDERAGAAASAECPGGGLHVYDITGDLEESPEKVGAWFIDAVKVQDGATCTSHVLRIYPEQEMLTIAWYAQGVRVLDISGLADAEGSATEVALGEGIGMKEVGSYVMPDADTWSFKTNRIAEDGSFYGYGNDLVRGFDVYRFEGLEDRRVPALEPREMRAGKRQQVSASAALVPAALLLPAMGGALWARRRTSRARG